MQVSSLVRELSIVLQTESAPAHISHHVSPIDPFEFKASVFQSNGNVLNARDGQFLHRFFFSVRQNMKYILNRDFHSIETQQDTLTSQRDDSIRSAASLIQHKFTISLVFQFA